jgi:maleylpyruvate isomerase
MNELERDIRGAQAAHARLAADLGTLTDEHMSRPSLLPGWSVAHVLSHLARNADSHVSMLAAAGRGEVGAQYPGGGQQRAGDIEAGAGRPAAQVVADVIDSTQRLQDAWSAMSATAWMGEGATIAGSVALRDLPFRRWRETVVHHSDLGLGYRWSDWPAEYVRLELARLTMLWASRRPMGLAALPAALAGLADHERAAWLLGRTTVPGLAPAGIF